MDSTVPRATGSAKEDCVNCTAKCKHYVSHIPLHTVILGPIIRGQPKTNLKVTFEQESKQIRYSKYHVKMK